MASTASSTYWQRYTEYLKKRGMTQLDVSNHALLAFGEAISPNTQKNWSKGRLPEALTLFRVAEILDVNPAYLIGRTDDPAPFGSGSTESGAAERADRLRQAAADRDTGEVSENDG